MKSKQRAKRTGGRSARVRHAVLEAALAELAARSYQEFTIGAVADRAGVHETSIYRRWGGREPLILDACMHVTEKNIVIPDTGSLSRDLQIVLMDIAAFLRTAVGRATVALAYTWKNSPEFASTQGEYWRWRLGRLKPIFERAVERGEWNPRQDINLAIGRLIGPIHAMLFLLERDVTERELKALVRGVMESRRPKSS